MIRVGMYVTGRRGEAGMRAKAALRWRSIPQASSVIIFIDPGATVPVTSLCRAVDTNNVRVAAGKSNYSGKLDLQFV
jgi:hypothetical protein